VAVAPSGLARSWGIDPGAACSLRFALAPGYLLSAPAALPPSAPGALPPSAPVALPSVRAWGSPLFHPSRHLPINPRDKFEPHRNRRLLTHGYNPLTRPDVSMSHRRERRRRGQKVARGKRAARSPWIGSNKEFRPDGPTEHCGARGCRPFGAGALWWSDPGAACSLRFALAPGYLLSAPAALPPSAPVALPSSAPGALPSSAPGALPPSAPEAPVCSTRVAICRSTRETNLSHTAIEDSGGKAIQLQRVRLKLQLNAFGVSTFCAKPNV
jgi:hypothetical protein